MDCELQTAKKLAIFTTKIEKSLDKKDFFQISKHAHIQEIYKHFKKKEQLNALEILSNNFSLKL
jgi:hypothetical protein